MLLAEWAEGGEIYHIAIDDTYVYFTATFTSMETLETFGEVWQVAKDGSTTTALSNGETPPPHNNAYDIAYNIAVDDTHVYWANYGDGTIKRAEKNTFLGRSNLAVEQQLPTGIAVDDNYVYWVDLIDGIVRLVPKGGPVCGGAGNPECTELGSGPPGARHLVVDAENIYWTIAGDHDGAVAKLSKNGGGVEFLAEGQANPYRIVVDSDNVYWMNRGTSGAGYLDGTVVGMPKNGGDLFVYADEVYESITLAADETHLYWGERGLARILKVPKVGGPVSISVDSPVRVDGGNIYAETGVFAADIAIDESAIYWAYHFGGLVLKIVK
jgi:hypothetical protein